MPVCLRSQECGSQGQKEEGATAVQTLFQQALRGIKCDDFFCLSSQADAAESTVHNTQN